MPGALPLHDLTVMSSPRCGGRVPVGMVAQVMRPLLGWSPLLGGGAGVGWGVAPDKDPASSLPEPCGFPPLWLSRPKSDAK